MAFLGKARKQDLVLLAEELGQKKNALKGETKEKIARQLCYESELNELRLQIESIRSNVKRTSCAEDRKNTSSNYRISIGRAGEHMRETSPAVLMAEATIPVTTPIKEENGMDDLRVVYVKVKGEQEMANAVMDTGAQMPVVRPDVVEGQSIDNRGSIQITSAFGEHEMGEVKDSNMELNDFRHGVVPVSKNLVNDMLICSSDYEVLIENSQMIRNPAKLREPSKKEGIISSTDSKSVCSQEVVTDLLPETQSLLNVPNGDLVAVKINGSNVQTNGQGIKESKGEVVLTCEFKKESCIVLGVVAPVRNVFLILLTQPRVAPHAILYQTLSEYLVKQLRLISGREILSLYTPPPAEAGVMWRVRLGSRVVGELICRYR
ncbi:hypothetical protein TNCV_1488861 [Trichonephila clavipes]|nr:hypothetical protein TNCV_1488861 [Trichonephila clavipes]